MSPLPFIIGAYAATLAATILLAVLSYRAMREAERKADELRRER
jgi:hypothetical protein